MDYTKDFLGRGLAFPVASEDATGRVALAEYEKDIEQAIRIILMTKCGERVMRPEFGSRLHEYVFSSRGYTNENQIKSEVVRCLTLWEPRITDLDVEVEFTDQHGGGFLIKLFYTVRSTNNIFNLVFPYFLTEGV